MPSHTTFTVPPAPALFSSNKHATLSPPTGSPLPHLFLALALPLALASPPFRHRSATFSALILALVAWSLRDPRFTDDPGVAQPAALLWANWLGVLEKLYCGGAGGGGGGRAARPGKRAPLGPESLFWRADRPAREAEAMAPLGRAKLAWALGLAVNLRGVRWSHEVKGVPGLSGRERKGGWRYLASRVAWVAYVLLMGDVVNHVWMQLYYVARVPESGAYTDVGGVDSKYLTIRDPDWRWRLVKTLFWGPLPYYFINFQYYFLSVVAVALGLTKPEDWPPFFGRLSDVTTVRAFWGRFWQQLIRRAFNTFTGAAVDFLGVARGTTASSQAQIWLSFLLSGFMHAYANLISVAPANVTVAERTGGMFAFFMWQAAAISAEDLVQWGWRRAWEGAKGEDPLPRWVKSVVGWCWVVTSFYISMPWAADVTLRMRIGDEPMLPVSVAGPAVGRVFEIIRSW